MRDLVLPYFKIHKKTVSEVWEEAVRTVMHYGRLDDHYGREIVGFLIVDDPFAEPRVHKGDWLIAVKGTLESYYNEVLEGTMDYAIEEEKQPYTYHQRLFNYPMNPFNVDQIKSVVEGLLYDMKRKDITNQNQAITWHPSIDPDEKHPPCLQRVWAKVKDGRLEMHTTWRSRDCYKAANMNMLALTMLQKYIANKINIPVGSYVDFSNSLHVYKPDWEQANKFIEIAWRRRHRDKIQNNKA